MDHRIKLAWARRHLETLQEAIDRFLEDKAYDAGLERKLGTHDYIIRFHVNKEIPLEWSSIVGDVVHNARSALDTLAYSLVVAYHGAPTEKEAVSIQFPLADAFEQFTDRGSKNVVLMSPGAQAAIERLQPYHRLDKSVKHWLSVLRDLSNVDKHRHLILTYATALNSSVDIEIDGAYAFTIAGGYVGPLVDGAILTAGKITGGLALDAKVDMHPRATVQIAFPDGWPAYGGNVRHTLKTTCDFIEDNVFRWLEPFL